MLMHSCCHILFIVLIGFAPKFKRISKTLENGLENQIRKKKNFFSSPSLLSAQSACCLPHRAGPRARLLSSVLGRPSPRCNRCRSLLLSAVADCPGPLVGTSSILPLESDARARGETVAAHVCSSHRGSVSPRLALLSGSRTRRRSLYSPPRSISPVCATTAASQDHRRRRPLLRVAIIYEPLSSSF